MRYLLAAAVGFVAGVLVAGTSRQFRAALDEARTAARDTAGAVLDPEEADATAVLRSMGVAVGGRAG